jgi:hypothetical protein
MSIRDVLFETLKIKHNAHHHGCDTNGWDMAETIERVVMNKTKDVIQSANLLSLSYDEVTVDCQSQSSVLDYIAREWKWILLILTLEKFLEGSTKNYLIFVIVNVARAYGGLHDQNITEKVDHIRGRWGVYIPRCEIR